jgi:hypothetical protein
MATVQEHYDNLLAGAYTWMAGGFEAAQARFVRFFRDMGIAPQGSAWAVDLGSGPGFQAIPLADAGFRVLAIDTSQTLLEELQARRESRDIKIVCADMMSFAQHLERPVGLAVCMTDTLLHLESRERVGELVGRVFAALEPGGRFIVTFRDLSQALVGADRFIPVRSDDARIFSCFLEYEPEVVNVHDLLYTNTAAGWRLDKSYYQKLRLSREWVVQSLQNSGFTVEVDRAEGNAITLVARKR